MSNNQEILENANKILDSLLENPYKYHWDKIKLSFKRLIKELKENQTEKCELLEQIIKKANLCEKQSNKFIYDILKNSDKLNEIVFKKQRKYYNEEDFIKFINIENNSQTLNFGLDCGSLANIFRRDSSESDSDDMDDDKNHDTTQLSKKCNKRKINLISKTNKLNSSKITGALTREKSSVLNKKTINKSIQSDDSLETKNMSTSSESSANKGKSSHNLNQDKITRKSECERQLWFKNTHHNKKSPHQDCNQPSKCKEFNTGLSMNINRLSQSQQMTLETPHFELIESQDVIKQIQNLSDDRIQNLNSSDDESCPQLKIVNGKRRKIQGSDDDDDDSLESLDISQSQSNNIKTPQNKYIVSQEIINHVKNKNKIINSKQQEKNENHELFKDETDPVLIRKNQIRKIKNKPNDDDDKSRENLEDEPLNEKMTLETPHFEPIESQDVVNQIQNLSNDRIQNLNSSDDDSCPQLKIVNEKRRKIQGSDDDDDESLESLDMSQSQSICIESQEIIKHVKKQSIITNSKVNEHREENENHELSKDETSPLLTQKKQSTKRKKKPNDDNEPLNEKMTLETPHFELIESQDVIKQIQNLSDDRIQNLNSSDDESCPQLKIVNGKRRKIQGSDDDDDDSLESLDMSQSQSICIESQEIIKHVKKQSNINNSEKNDNQKVNENPELTEDETYSDLTKNKKSTTTNNKPNDDYESIENSEDIPESENTIKEILLMEFQGNENTEQNIVEENEEQIINESHSMDSPSNEYIIYPN